MTIAIIGGGLSGITLALTLSYLSHSKISIDLIATDKLDDPDYLALDNRSIALAYNSYHALNNIGIWTTLASHATAVNQIEISSNWCISKVKINSNDYKIPMLGYVIGLRDLYQQLFNLLIKTSGIKLHYPAKSIYIVKSRTENIITLDNGTKIYAQLTVVANGSSSILAKQCGIRWYQQDYYQTAITTNISTDIPNYHNAFEHFTSNGSLALLPIAKGRSAIIWCVPSLYQKDIMGWKTLKFNKELQKIFGWRLGYINDSNERQYHSLFLRKAVRHVTHRVALIGNAAQTIHPIAGQGFNLGLRDVLTLAEIIVQASIQGKDIGDYTVLMRYQRLRQPDQAKIIMITHSLIYLFNKYHLPLLIMRNLGLLIIANMPSLRNAIIIKSLGQI